MTQGQVGALAQLTAGSVGALERAQRRTRRSTLERLVVALVAEDRREVVLEELVEAAGPALAVESTWLERLERRQARREHRELPEAIVATRDAVQSARRLAGLYPEGDPRRDAALENVERLQAILEELEGKAAAKGLVVTGRLLLGRYSQSRARSRRRYR